MLRTVTIAITTVTLSITAVAAAGAEVPRRDEPTGDLTVSAAASLTESFTEIGERFERRYEGVDVTFNFDASSALVIQIQQGAPVDVLASADEASMQKLVDGGEVTARPRVFAENTLEIATKPGNPERIRTVTDLEQVDTVALCAAEVPCGKYADAALEAAGVELDPDRVTRGVDAKATLAAVSEGDADAAIVYRTDVRAAGSAVDGVTIPRSQNQIAVYPIAELAEAPNGRAAKAFVDFVTSKAGTRVLRRYGFRVP